MEWKELHMELGVANFVTTLFIIEKYNLGVLFQMLFCSNTTFQQIIVNEEIRWNYFTNPENFFECIKSIYI